MTAALRRATAAPGAAAVLLLVAAAALGIGPIPVPPGQLINALSGAAEPRFVLAVQQLRLPRTVAAAGAGALLAFAGLLLQAVTRNDLAEGTTLGIAPAAGAAVVWSGVIGPVLPGWAGIAGEWWVRYGCAAFGSVLAVGLILLLHHRLSARIGRSASAGAETLVLIGLAIGASAQALITLGLAFGNASTQATLVWLTGSVAPATLTHGAITGGVGFVIIVLSRVLCPALDLLRCDALTAHGRGMLVRTPQAAAAMIAALSVAAA